jgi:AcrR family transcriptional regulator
MDHLFPVKETTSTKRKIFDTAVDLFSQNGYSAVSVREITKQVGIKESALYNHFKTKDEIIETIYAAFRSENLQKSLPPLEQLDAILERMTPEAFLMQGFASFKRIVDHPVMMKMWRILITEQFRDPRAREIILNDIYKRTIDFLETAFLKLIDRGLIQPREARQLAFEYQYPIFAVMTEYVLLKYDNKDSSELEIRVQQHIQFFIQNTTST